MAQHHDPFRVLIIGAGASGLLIGQGLKQAGIECTIYERSDHSTYADRSRDWSMGLHWGGDPLQACLPEALKAQLKSTETDPWIELTPEQNAKMPIINGRTGEILVRLQAISTRRVSRAKFRQALSVGLDIRYGRTLVNISLPAGEDRVVASFSNNEEARGNILIGCDSSNSFVRAWLLGDDKARCEEAPVISYNFSCTYTAEQAAWLRRQGHPLMKCSPHPDQNTWYIIPMLEVRDPDSPETWVFQHFMNLWTEDATPSTSDERLKHFKELAENYTEPFKSAARWVPSDTNVSYDRIKHWPNALRWDNHGGRVTLAGDAAHPMLPYRAQGLNNALADAALFVNSIKQVIDDAHVEEEGLKEIIDTYDQEVFERGSQEIKLSAEQGYAAMHWEKYMQSPSTRYGQHSTYRKSE
ncbi:MAG: hypothetical protein M1822_006561 [Bathelium mastoideum]|nr:MAG: hypothetical protein M1822_006561 [Bathelium mastoideum]